MTVNPNHTYRILKESSPGRTKLHDTSTDSVGAAAQIALSFLQARPEGEVTVYVEGEPFGFERWNDYLFSYMGCLDPKGDLRERLRRHVERGAKLLKSAA